MSKKQKDTEPEVNETSENTQETEKAADNTATEEEKTAQAPSAPTQEELIQAEKDKYMRLAAEYDNFRKRSQRERDAIYQQVKSDTVLKILPVYDNLARALSLTCADEAFFKGIEMTMTQLLNIFEELGVKPIDALGQKFDANLHNAVMHVEDDEHGESEIVEEFQKGFTLGDKVIRHSMVKVAN
jgi:molecular chaperone GrpE